MPANAAKTKSAITLFAFRNCEIPLKRYSGLMKTAGRSTEKIPIEIKNMITISRVRADNNFQSVFDASSGF